MTHQDIQKALKSLASPERKKTNEWFFKTGKGQYGYGDKFIGVSGPDMHAVAKKFIELPLTEVKKLIQSKIHEERFVALSLLVKKYQKSKDPAEHKKIYNFYISQTKHINNWDLVDVSAHKIVGAYLLTRPKSERKLLYKLAKSKSLWEQRIAVITTFAFIYDNDFDYTYKLADVLMLHEHDLIHKAVGWMLREAGKRDQARLEKWLKPRYKLMPRTMLRYTIEKFAKPKYKAYLKGNA